MKTYGMMLTLALAAGCSDGHGAFATSEANDAPGAAQAGAEIGQAHERSQFADDTVFPIVDLTYAALEITTDITPVDVNIFYCSDKTTNSGHTVGTVMLKGTLSLAADKSKRFVVNLNDTAFTGGYGSIVVQSLGGTNQDVFQTYLHTGPELFSVGGSVFTGGSYRIPFFTGTSKVVLAMTNQSDFDFDVTISNVGAVGSKTITLPVLSTYKFDSSANGFNVSATQGSIQVTTTNGGTVGLNGYVLNGTTKVRAFPVKAAPYFQL